MQKRKKSKDSAGSKGSDEEDEHHDYITIEVYIRKSQAENKTNTGSSLSKPTEGLQKNAQTGL